MTKPAMFLLAASALATAAAGVGCSSTPKRVDSDTAAKAPMIAPTVQDSMAGDFAHATASSADLGASSSGRGR